MSILITGGAGYIGSHIVERLIKNKIKVIILDNLNTGHKKLINKKAFFIRGDINDKNLVKNILKSYNVKTIIHLAACLNVNEAEINPQKYMENNVKGTENLLLSCKNSIVKNIIFSSSCSIYGNINGAVNENKKPNPEGKYAYSKYLGEKLIKKYSKKFNFKYGIFRYFNVAGASNSGKVGEVEKSYGHLIKNIAIQSLKKRAVIKIFGNNYPTKDGTCVRDYIHVSDLTDLHIKGINYLIKNKKSFILNCGYGKGYSVLNVVNVFKKIKKNLVIIYQKKRFGDVPQVYSNTKKIEKMFKWKPKHNDINKIIRSAIRWEKIFNKTNNK